MGSWICQAFGDHMLGDNCFKNIMPRIWKYFCFVYTAGALLHDILHLPDGATALLFFLMGAFVTISSWITALGVA